MKHVPVIVLVAMVVSVFSRNAGATLVSDITGVVCWLGILLLLLEEVIKWWNPLSLRSKKEVKTKLVLVIINEQHNLLSDQETKLNEKFGEGSWEKLNVPANGWTSVEQEAKLKEIGKGNVLVFASPLPLMLLRATQEGRETFVFHNDLREKKELPDGRIIFTVAKSGWEIL